VAGPTTGGPFTPPFFLARYLNTPIKHVWLLWIRISFNIWSFLVWSRITVKSGRHAGWQCSYRFLQKRLWLQCSVAWQVHAVLISRSSCFVSPIYKHSKCFWLRKKSSVTPVWDGKDRFGDKHTCMIINQNKHVWHGFWSTCFELCLSERSPLPWECAAVSALHL